MNKDVLVSFTSIQYDAGAANRTELDVQGLYYKKNNKHYLLYDEFMEGFKEPVKTKVIFAENVIEIVRSGPINVRMTFEEDKKNVANYLTPYGNIMLDINTKKISISETPDNIVISVDYTLEADNEKISDAGITIRIKS